MCLTVASLSTLVFKAMKKYLLKIVLFFGIVAVVDSEFGKTCEWLQLHAKGGQMKCITQAALVQESDIIIMGSSRANHHYVSSVLADSLGVSVYNAGVDGNGIVLASGLYAMMTSRYTPKVVIYDVEPAFDINVYSEDGNNTRYLGSLRPYFANEKVRDIITRVDPVERYKDISSMFRYNSKIFDLIKDQFVVGGFVEDGFVPVQGTMTKEPEIKTDGKPSQTDEMKLEFLDEFVAELSNSDTRLIVVASPKYGAVTSEVFEPVKEICNRYGVEFWDCYSAPEFQKLEYFKEQMHLNEAGAKYYSAILAQRLKNILN